MHTRARARVNVCARRERINLISVKKLLTLQIYIYTVYIFCCCNITIFCKDHIESYATLKGYYVTEVGTEEKNLIVKNEIEQMIWSRTYMIIIVK